jgi:hypothetical protein
LWVINRVHAKLQLRLVGIPTTLAYQQIVRLGLDDFFPQLDELELLSASVADSNCFLAGSESVCH